MDQSSDRAKELDKSAPDTAKKLEKIMACEYKKHKSAASKDGTGSKWKEQPRDPISIKVQGLIEKSTADKLSTCEKLKQMEEDLLNFTKSEMKNLPKLWKQHIENMDKDFATITSGFQEALKTIRDDEETMEGLRTQMKDMMRMFQHTAPGMFGPVSGVFPPSAGGPAPNDQPLPVASNIRAYPYGANQQQQQRPYNPTNQETGIQGDQSAGQFDNHQREAYEPRPRLNQQPQMQPQDYAESYAVPSYQYPHAHFPHQPKN